MATRGRRRERWPASSMNRTVRLRDWRSASGVMGLGWCRTEGRWFSSNVDCNVGRRGGEGGCGRGG